MHIVFSLNSNYIRLKGGNKVTDSTYIFSLIFCIFITQHLGVSNSSNDVTLTGRWKKITTLWFVAVKINFFKRATQSRLGLQMWFVILWWSQPKHRCKTHSLHRKLPLLVLLTSATVIIILRTMLKSDRSNHCFTVQRRACLLQMNTPVIRDEATALYSPTLPHTLFQLSTEIKLLYVPAQVKWEYLEPICSVKVSTSVCICTCALLMPSWQVVHSSVL